MLSLFWDFILTKWYVKMLFEPAGKEAPKHFILTKWYVKLKPSTVLLAALSILY
ncbi:TPA: hypothetical protein ACMU8S_003768 [Clostridioides difficile]